MYIIEMGCGMYVHCTMCVCVCVLCGLLGVFEKRPTFVCHPQFQAASCQLIHRPARNNKRTKYLVS